MASLTRNSVKDDLNFYIINNRDRKFNINNHKIEDSNLILRSGFEHYKILMSAHTLLPCCDVMIPKLVKKGPNSYITYKWQ